MLADFVILVGVPFAVLAVFAVAIRLVFGRSGGKSADDATWWQAIK